MEGRDKDALEVAALVYRPHLRFPPQRDGDAHIQCKLLELAVRNVNLRFDASPDGAGHVLHQNPAEID